MVGFFVVYIGFERYSSVVLPVSCFLLLLLLYSFSYCYYHYCTAIDGAIASFRYLVISTISAAVEMDWYKSMIGVLRTDENNTIAICCNSRRQKEKKETAF